MKGFKVYPIDTATGVRAAGRRDLYTLCLLTGPHQLRGADGEIERDGTYLVVGNSGEISALRSGLKRQTGYGCLFTEEFIRAGSLVKSQQPWALLTGNQPSSISLGDQQAAYLTSLFEKMLAEQQSAYRFKDELLRSYLQLVLHEAMRLRQFAPSYRFRYYYRRPEPAGGLGSGWARRG